MSKVIILVVEDDVIEAMDIKRILESMGYSVPETASSGEEALQKLTEFKPDVILMDIILSGGMDGIETADVIKNQYKIPIIYLTAYSETETIERAKLTEPYAYLIKPFNSNELKNSIEIVIYKDEMETKLKAEQEHFKNLFENAPVGIFHSTPDGKICRVNKVLSNMWGYDSPEELIKDVNKTNIMKKLYVDQQNHREFVDEVLTDKNWHSYNNRYYKKDGSIMTAELSFRAVRDGNSSIIYLEGFVKDVTDKIQAENALKESESRYKLISENTGDVIWIMNIVTGKFTYVSPSVYQLLGYKSEEILNRPIKDVITQEAYKFISNNMSIRIKGFLSGNDNFQVMTHFIDQIDKEGKIVPTEVVTTLILNKEGQINEILGVSRDISERRLIEESLIESEEKYRTLFESNPDYTLLLDTDGKIVDVNQASLNVIGLSKDEFIGKQISDLDIVLEEDLNNIVNLPEMLDGHPIKPFEVRLIDKDGKVRWINVQVTTIEKNAKTSFILIIAIDITESKQFEIKLTNSIREKEVLLQEIHHRVKNNMQIISSLLNIQTRYVDDAESVNVLKESQNRVKSMAMIHEKLYNSRSFNKIYFVDYIESLVWDLFYSYSIKKGTIKPVLDIDDIKLNIETSVPCGLIITELVSNCLKYAFPDGRQGELKVSLKIKDDYYQLNISDNGIGFPENIDFKNTESLGLQLVNSLTDQIDGEIELDNTNGTEFKIKFQELVYKDRI